jgi:hypothetical protein
MVSRYQASTESGVLILISKPSSAVELLRYLKAIGDLAQQILDFFLLADLRHVYIVGLEALKRDVEQVWQQRLRHLDLQTSMVAFPMRLYGNPIHSWRWA